MLERMPDLAVILNSFQNLAKSGIRSIGFSRQTKALIVQRLK